MAETDVAELRQAPDIARLKLDEVTRKIVDFWKLLEAMPLVAKPRHNLLDNLPLDNRKVGRNQYHLGTVFPPLYLGS